MKKLFSLGIVAGLLAVACAAYAYPSLAGYTGTGVLPTASVVPGGQWQLAADFYNTEETVEVLPGVFADTETAYPIRALLGLGDVIEIGAGYTFQQFADENANTWDANVKYLTSLTPFGFAWSLGARYSSTDLKAAIIDETINTTNIYFVGTRSFSGLAKETPDMPGINGTIGVSWTQRDFFETEDAFRVFGGVDVSFRNRFSLAADIQSSDDNLDENALFSVVARYAFSPSIGAQVGMTNADITGVSGGEDSNLFAGINLAFGGESEDEGY